MSNDLQFRRLNSRITSVNNILDGRINDIIFEHDGFTLPEEITRATAAEAALGQRITDEIAAEVTRASGEEAANALDILTEESRALAAEAVMRADIVGLTQEDLDIRAAGEKLSTNISQETARAMTAENSLQTTQ